MICSAPSWVVRVGPVRAARPVGDRSWTCSGGCWAAAGADPAVRSRSVATQEMRQRSLASARMGGPVGEAAVSDLSWSPTSHRHDLEGGGPVVPDALPAFGVLLGQRGTVGDRVGDALLHRRAVDDGVDETPPVGTGELDEDPLPEPHVSAEQVRFGAGRTGVAGARHQREQFEVRVRVRIVELLGAQHSVAGGQVHRFSAGASPDSGLEGQHVGRITDDFARSGGADDAVLVHGPQRTAQLPSGVTGDRARPVNGLSGRVPTAERRPRTAEPDRAVTVGRSGPIAIAGAGRRRRPDRRGAGPDPAAGSAGRSATAPARGPRGRRPAAGPTPARRPGTCPRFP